MTPEQVAASYDQIAINLHNLGRPTQASPLILQSKTGA